MLQIGDIVNYNSLTGFVVKLDKDHLWVKWFTLGPEYPYLISQETLSLIKKVS